MENPQVNAGGLRKHQDSREFLSREVMALVFRIPFDLVRIDDDRNRIAYVARTANGIVPDEKSFSKNLFGHVGCSIVVLE